MTTEVTVTVPIRVVAKEMSLPISTLRYWEEVGLIPPIPRNESGRREYARKDIHWIEFVKCMRASGMPLAKLRQFAELRRNQGDLEEQLAILQAHQTHIEEQLESLQAMHGFMNKKIAMFEDVIAKVKAHGEA